jgi:hypothetical protein
MGIQLPAEGSPRAASTKSNMARSASVNAVAGPGAIPPCQRPTKKLDSLKHLCRHDAWPNQVAVRP